MRGSLLILCVIFFVTGAEAAETLGVSYRDGVTTLRVWAPHAQSVEIIGDFNGWRAASNDRLAPDPQSPGVWAISSRRSAPRGPYQWLINGQMRKRDPYARAVTPDSRKSLFYDANAFAWGADRGPEFSLDELVIYELHVGAFNDPKPQDGMPGTFYDAIKRLDQLVWLGVNVVELMPVHEFNGSRSWGYNPSDLFAVEQTYGGADGLKAFVKACHARGLAVHLDIVHNHYGPENLDLKIFDGREIYFYEGAGIDRTPWGPRVKFDDPQVRKFVRDNALMWLDEYHVDGFRWDSTINIRAYNDGATPIPAGLQMLEDINAEIRADYPKRFSIAEDSLDQGGFHASWDYDFHHAVMPVLQKTNDNERSMAVLSEALTKLPTSMGRVIYVDNHDEAGKINGQLRIFNDIAPRNPSGEYARRLAGLGAVLTLTAPGTPLLFMGNEMQQTGAFHEDQWLDWGNWTRHADFVLLHRDLIRLRRNLDGFGDALKGLGVNPALVDDSRKALAFWRWNDNGSDEQMVIAINFSGKPATDVPIPFPSAGPWQVRLDTDWIAYGGKTKPGEPPIKLEGGSTKAAVSLAPYSARIYTLAKASEASKSKAAAAVVELPPPEKPPFSMYATINLVGGFNASNLTANRMTLKRDYYWEGRVHFNNLTGTWLRVSANDDGKIFWASAGASERGAPLSTTLARLGADLRIEGPLDGSYLARFNEDTLEFSLDPLAAGDEPQFRWWTDSRGNKVEAALVTANFDTVTLKRRDGKVMEVPRTGLSQADQEFLKR